MQSNGFTSASRRFEQLSDHHCSNSFSLSSGHDSNIDEAKLFGRFRDKHPADHFIVKQDNRISGSGILCCVTPQPGVALEFKKSICLLCAPTPTCDLVFSRLAIKLGQKVGRRCVQITEYDIHIKKMLQTIGNQS